MSKNIDTIGLSDFVNPRFFVGVFIILLICLVKYHLSGNYDDLDVQYDNYEAFDVDGFEKIINISTPESNEAPKNFSVHYEKVTVTQPYSFSKFYYVYEVAFTVKNYNFTIKSQIPRNEYYLEVKNLSKTPIKLFNEMDGVSIEIEVVKDSTINNEDKLKIKDFQKSIENMPKDLRIASFLIWEELEQGNTKMKLVGDDQCIIQVAKDILSATKTEGFFFYHFCDIKLVPKYL